MRTHLKDKLIDLITNFKGIPARNKKKIITTTQGREIPDSDDAAARIFFILAVIVHKNAAMQNASNQENNRKLIEGFAGKVTTLLQKQQASHAGPKKAK